jgi:hypothetical protein
MTRHPLPLYNVTSIVAVARPYESMTTLEPRAALAQLLRHGNRAGRGEQLGRTTPEHTVPVGLHPGVIDEMRCDPRLDLVHPGRRRADGARSAGPTSGITSTATKNTLVTRTRPG